MKMALDIDVYAFDLLFLFGCVEIIIISYVCVPRKFDFDWYINLYSPGCSFHKLQLIHNM